MAANAAENDHQANRLIAALDPETYELLRPHLQVQEMPVGKLLYEGGETVHHAYFPHDCIISLVSVMEEGGIAEMATIGREGVIGFLTGLGSQQALGRYFIQLPGTASRISIERLRAAYEVSPRLQVLLAHYVEAFLAQTLQLVACNALHPVEARCCRWILMTYDRVQRPNLPLTQEFLGEMLGVQRSTVSVVTRTLQTAQLITSRRGVIRVEDVDGLREGACECYGIIRRNFARILPEAFGGAADAAEGQPGTASRSAR